MRGASRELVRDAPTALVRMLDAIIDRLADELEDVSSEIEQISQPHFPAAKWTSGGFRRRG